MEKRLRAITFALSFGDKRWRFHDENMITAFAICNFCFRKERHYSFSFRAKQKAGTRRLASKHRIMQKKINSALISVFYKDGLDAVVKQLSDLGIKIYSTGGTQKFIEQLGLECEAVENLTTYPSILGGRVKTLHPSVFGGILGRRDLQQDRLEQLSNHGSKWGIEGNLVKR